MSERRIGLSGSTLKLIALASMIIDHVGASVIKRLYNMDPSWHDWYWLCREIGRIAFPVYCFLLVEGFLHTKSVVKFARNIILFALVSEIPFNLALYGKWIQLDLNYFLHGSFQGTHQNVLFTFFIGIVMLSALRQAAQKEEWKSFYRILVYPIAFLCGAFAVYLVSGSAFGEILSLVKYSPRFYLIAVIAGAGAVVISLFLGANADWNRRISVAMMALILIIAYIVAAWFAVDYLGWGILVIFAMYVLRRQKTAAYSTGCILLICMQTIEWSAMLGLPAVALYNGRRGLKVKYLFYLAYPLHFVILYLVCIGMGIA